MVRILTLAMLALAVSAMPAWAEGQGAFKFEDYREKTAFITTVNQRFPVGSSYLAFKRAVIPAGAKAKRDMVDNANTGTHLFQKQQRSTTGRNFIATWTIAVTETDDIITAITPTLVISSSIGVDD